MRTSFQLLAGQDGSARGAPLAALRDTDLERRFYCWHGVDQRFVCSVFPVEDEGLVAEFTRVVVLGVNRSDDEPRPLCIIESCRFRSPEGCALRAAAHAAGCTEWHVYFNENPDQIKAFAALFQF